MKTIKRTRKQKYRRGGSKNKRRRSNKDNDRRKRHKKYNSESTSQWPKYYGPGETLTIDNLIQCIAVVIKKFDSIKKKTVVGAIGGHFVTFNSFSNGKLKSEGVDFMTEVGELLETHDMTPKNSRVMIIFKYQGNGKVHPITDQAAIFLQKEFKKKEFKVQRMVTKKKSSKPGFSVYPSKYSFTV
jgi:hypothetical protein